MVLLGSHDRRVLWNNSDVLSNPSLHYRYVWLTRNISKWLRVILVKHLVFVCELWGKLWRQKLQVVQMGECCASDLQNIICCHSFHIFIMIFIVIVCIMYKYHLCVCVCVYVCVIIYWWTDCQSLMTFVYQFRPFITVVVQVLCVSLCVCVCVCVCVLVLKFFTCCKQEMSVKVTIFLWQQVAVIILVIARIQIGGEMKWITFWKEDTFWICLWVCYKE